MSTIKLDIAQRTSFVSQENMVQLQKVFNQFDANNDGEISVTELGDVLKTLGSSYTEEELKRVMEDIDTDKDGFINLSEFCSLCRSSFDAVAATLSPRCCFLANDENHQAFANSVGLPASCLSTEAVETSSTDCSKSS
ncbi:probable calcium-binding protein CML27 [Durio zibethinus]|uniref:Probable calcium-binding protein CML27 n=1 Tax=Durio zibethinus TaxID=66656 RepID=A0A6P6A585_DURZI|nr:probable calcium-binding protein CML27 [Durio zibethinus]